MGTPARAATRSNRRKNERAGRSNDGAGSGVVNAAGSAAASDSDPVADAASGPIVDPASIGNSAASDSGGSDPSGSTPGERVKRKYTRRASKTADAVTLDLGSFKDILFSTHAMLASIASAPDLAIDEDEAEKLAKAIANVSRHYNVPTMAQETLDWIMLIQAGGAIYGPRIIAWRMDRMSRRVKPTPQSPMAPRNVAPSPSAANVAAEEKISATSEARGHITPAPVNHMRPPTTAPQARVQPGLDTLDGATLPIKMN